MVEDIGLYTLVGHPILDSTEEIKLHRNTMIGGLQLANHADKLLVHIGKALQIGSQISPEYSQVGLTAAVDKDGVINMMLFIYSSITASVCST